MAKWTPKPNGFATFGLGIVFIRAIYRNHAWVALRDCPDDGGCIARWDELREWTGSPAPAPAEEKWVPKAGKKAVCTFDNQQFEILAIHEDFAWCRAGEFYTTIGLEGLRPLPPEPPVLPCPHCGTEGVVQNDWHRKSYWVRCPNNCQTNCDTQEEAVRRWNQRVEAQVR